MIRKPPAYSLTTSRVFPTRVTGLSGSPALQPTRTFDFRTRFRSWQGVNSYTLSGDFVVWLEEPGVPYFRPSFLPAASSATDSRMRRSRVSGRFAMWIQTTKLRRSPRGSF